jgi:hypothetical protein
VHFLLQHTKTGKNKPSEHEIYQTDIKFTECPT